MKLEIRSDQGIQVKGPTKLQVLNGCLSLLGAKLLPGQDVIIKSGKQYPFDVEEDAQVELIGSDLVYEIVDTPLIAPDRKELAQKLEKFSTPLKIFILGNIDTGKTTVICYLANHFYTLGKRVAVIDLDPGQQDIGPPSTITSGVLNQPILNLGEIPLGRMVFIGRTSPARRFLQTLSGGRELLDYALQEADVILIDTTGWVFGGAARAYKTAKIRNLKPNVLVALQRDDEIHHLLEPFKSSIPIEFLSVYPNIAPRNPEVRKFLRESKFNKYFSEATSRTFDLNKIKIENTIFKSGKPINELDRDFLEKKTLKCDFIYAEKAADALFLVKKPSSFYNKEGLGEVSEHFGISEIRIMSKNDEAGIIIGLLDNNFNTLGIGIIENIIYNENKIRVFTPVNQKVDILQFGYLKITKTGQELGELKYTF